MAAVWANQVGAGFGVEGIRERVRQIGGQLDIRTQPDRGTRMVVIVPLT